MAPMRPVLFLATLLFSGVVSAQSPDTSRPGGAGPAGEPSAEERSADAPRGGNTLTPVGA